MPPSWVFPAARGQTWMSVGFQLLAVWCLQLANFSVVHKYALVNYNPWHPGSPLSRNIFFFFLTTAHQALQLFGSQRVSGLWIIIIGDKIMEC